MTRKNFSKAIIVARYEDKEDNEQALKELSETHNDDVLIVSLNGHRRDIADCVFHTDYFIRKLNNAIHRDGLELPILTFREYRDSMPDYIIDCRDFEFLGSTLLTAINFFIASNIKDILLYVNNQVHTGAFKKEQKTGINQLLSYHPNCNIYQISEGNFDLEVIKVKDFVSGIHS